MLSHDLVLHYIRVYILAGAYEPPEGRKERPTPHYSVERHLNLNGRHTSLIWTYSQVGRKCCFHNLTNSLRYTPSVRLPYSAGDDCKRVTRVSQFTTETRKRTQDRKARKAASAVHARLYFPRGFRSRIWPSYAAICGVRDTAYFRRCASSSLGIFYGSMWRRGLPLSELFDPTFSFSCFIVVN